MKHFLLSLSFAILSLTASAQNVQTLVFKSVKSRDNISITAHFIAIDAILVSAKLYTDKALPVMRVERRTNDGFYLAIDALPMPDKMILVKVANKQVVLIDHLGQWFATLEWVYDGPVNGRGMDCPTCLDESESLIVLRRAFSNAK